MWKRALLTGLILIGGGAFVTIGVLLLFRPDLFLRFNDWLNPGDYTAKNAEWRKDVHNAEWKFLGLMFLAAGLFLLIIFIKLVLA